MNYLKRNVCAAVLLVGSVISLNAAGTKKDLPNIVIIMADDMGYSDIGCYGGEIATPNIDRLADEGMRFRQFYNDAKCNPSRSALLTGQYSHQGELKVGATFAEVLRTVGYQTWMAGKWHNTPMPTDYGFDRYYGLVDGCCNFWNPGIEARPGEGAPGRKEGRGNKPRLWGIEDKLIETGYTPEDKNFYTTDAFTSYAVDRLEEFKNIDKPFALYIAYTAPHYPIQAWPEDIEKYRDTYKMGWYKLRENRYKRMLELGIVDERYGIPPRAEGVKAWDSLSKKEQEEQAYIMAVYAAMIDRMDQDIGKVIAKLKEIGAYDNSIIIIMSDNGACSEPPNSTPDILPGPVESYRSVGRSWANASNTPLRQFKSTSYEGGTRTPMIVRWPGVVKPGSFSDHVAHFIDFTPTFMEITGAEYPSEIRGRKLLKLDGISFLPALQGKQQTEHPFLCWERNGSRAIRLDDWKLVNKKPKKGEDVVWELYNLALDPNEKNDLVTQYPAKVKKMAALWDEWKARGK